MRPAAHQPLFCGRAVPLLALAALLAIATGGAGLAHRVLAHTGVCSAELCGGHAQASDNTPCGSTPAKAPDQDPTDRSSEHDCDICTLLATGVTPPTIPDAAPRPRPTGLCPSTPAAHVPWATPTPFPPVRGPPSPSV